MKINNISKCCKPRRVSNFTGNELTDNSNKQMRFKHFEQMSDDVLMARSITKAHQKVQNSAKSHLSQAMPAITTALIGTSLALTQPGKLSAKAATGLGFLVASDVLGKVFNGVFNKIDEKHTNKSLKNSSETEDNTIKFAKRLTAVGAATVATVALAKNINKINNKKVNRTVNFIKKEAKNLAQEINSTKLGKFTEEKINPFINKHPKTKFALELAPFGLIVAGIDAQTALSKSLSKDFKREANKNFIKGKLIQDIARKEFDSIDAQEV